MKPGRSDHMTECGTDAGGKDIKIDNGVCVMCADAWPR